MAQCIEQIYNSGETMINDFTYTTPLFTKDQNGKLKINSQRQTMNYRFKTEPLQDERLGVMLVGLGGNNGTTLSGALKSNQLHAEFQAGKPEGQDMTWKTREGLRTPDYYGSMTQSATIYLGEYNNAPVYVPFNKIVPMADPNKIVVTGWDINGMDMYNAMIRAHVLSPQLVDKLRPYMEPIKPMPSVYYKDFIASNQEDRADNVIPMSAGMSKWDHVELIRQDIRNFKQANNLKKVIVLWTANTERYALIQEGLNDKWVNLERMLKVKDKWDSEIAPSTIFATACLLEGTPFINGSPQNTFVPAVQELAQELYIQKQLGKFDGHVFIAGDDFKTGQTKLKSVLVEFLVGAGIKPMSMISYNHLGNNDGKNLVEEKQFKSKEISKAGVVEDVVSSNPILFKEGEKPDHLVVIKYCPYVGDSKRAMDEYISEIGMGGKLTYIIHNTCEDSLLAFAVMLDLIIGAELFTRISYSQGQNLENFTPMHPILSFLGYWCKAPLFQQGIPPVNALNRQRQALENFLKILAGLPIDTAQLFEYRAPPVKIWWIADPI